MAEDIKERTYRFSLSVISLLDSLPEGYVAQTLGRQLLRAATSVGANVIEAVSSASVKDFVNFYTIALKSANETKYWLRLLRDSGKVKARDVESRLDEGMQIAKILAVIILKLKRK